MNYICHSGGCPGADMMWETEGKKYGVTTIAYSFYNHIQKGSNPKILTPDELNEGFEHVKIAGKALRKNTSGLYNYTKNLLSRNWFQVKNSDAIYAIGMFDITSKNLSGYYKLVSGGTGWAVQMGIDNEKDIYFFDQETKQWFWYDYPWKVFIPIAHIPKLTQNFAGIGTRVINENGVQAIKECLQYNFSL